MALFDNILNIGCTAMQSAMAYAQLHSGDPGAAGTSNVTTAARQAMSWDTAANGDMVQTTDIPFTGVAANGGVTHVSFWSASTGGTCYGWVAITTGDVTANAAGEYVLLGVTIPGTAS